MDQLKLRTLARKSIIGFGFYKDLTVQNLLDQGRKAALRAIYFNLARISFADDILEELSITEVHRIEKPGKSREMKDLFYEDLKIKRDVEGVGVEPLKEINSVKKTVGMARKATDAATRNVYHSKRANQNRNHGHKTKRS